MKEAGWVGVCSVRPNPALLSRRANILELILDRELMPERLDSGLGVVRWLLGEDRREDGERRVDGEYRRVLRPDRREDVGSTAHNARGNRADESIMCGARTACVDTGDLFLTTKTLRQSRLVCIVSNLAQTPSGRKYSRCARARALYLSTVHKYGRLGQSTGSKTHAQTRSFLLP